jgi:hypothetical protein
MSTLQIWLLVSAPTSSSSRNTNKNENDLHSLAQQVSAILHQQYQLSRVWIRSALTPADRLLSAVNNNNTQDATLVVVLGPATASTMVLESEGTAPLLNVDNSSTTASPDAHVLALRIAKYASLASPQLRRIIHSTVTAHRQAQLVQDATHKTLSLPYANAIAHCYDHHLTVTGDAIDVPHRLRGKVRDRYILNDRTIALVTTDRQSGFDRHLAQVPFKGVVLNMTSAYWFAATRYIIPNHLIATPHPNVSIVHACQPFPIEFVVRYVTIYLYMSVCIFVKYRIHGSQIQSFISFLLPLLVRT